MTYKYATFFKWVNLLVDFLLVNLALFISLVIEQPSYLWNSLPSHYKLNFLILNLFWFFCSRIVDLYTNVMKRDADETIRAAFTAIVIFTLIQFTLRLTFPQLQLTGKLITYNTILFSILSVVCKVSFLLLRKSRRSLWLDYKNIVIVGAGRVGMDLYNYINNNTQLGYKIEGIFDDSYSYHEPNNPILLGSVNDCFSYVKSNRVSEIYCALPNEDAHRTKALMQEADKQMIRMRLVPDLKEIYDKNVMLELYGHMPILTLRQEPLENKANEIIKRLFDIGFSLIVIVFLLSWLAPILALMIKLESKGPVFFKQLRSGKNNKPFYCYKFRSMAVNLQSDSLQATKGDMRVTKLGAILRKTSLDELPQFFNVLLGDMSVVGPRPHMLKHTEDYSVLIDNYMVRHFLTPGITGWAQVNGYRGETKETASMSNRVNADIWYLENWSLFLDLKIVFLTVWQAIRGNENAY